jgi:superfamily II DNA or RNA helicase
VAVTVARAVPEEGQLVLVRDRHWVVSDVSRGSLPVDPMSSGEQEYHHLVALSSVEDDGLGQELKVIWEVEVGARILQTATLPRPAAGAFDDPDRLDAFLDAVRWGAVTSADPKLLQAPFRSGITIEDYQLQPVVQALHMPRVNLLIADDVGLGKTIEAGLVVEELLLRHRARTVMVVCPASLCLKWKAEMQEKFGLEFRIVNSETLSELRRTRGVQANPWRHFPRLIVSIDWLKRPRPMRLLDEVLPADANQYPRAFDMLIVDEVHTCAPSGRGQYAVDSYRTDAIRKLAPHFEHHLFLSATPHNGYIESFTGLLALLDPQRFARGVRPSQETVAQVMVRRLKSELRETLEPLPDGRPRFPVRVLVPLEVEYSDEERQAHADLTAYSESRHRQAGEAGASRLAADLVTILLKKRLFSSPAAFGRTLQAHRDTLAHRAAGASSRALQQAADRLDEDFDNEEAQAEAAEAALATAARTVAVTTPEQKAILARLAAYAERASQRPDTKAERLIDWLISVVRPDGDWNDERVIVFTEYRDTQRWLADLLTARGLGGDRLALIYGGMEEDDRETIKAQFQAHPTMAPLRILLATDAASEGIDLQRQCYRMVHVEIPFNPMRLEQRNGRIDRHGQRSPEVLIHHFVGRGWERAPAGSLDADLEFLFRAARKIETIRDDLGSASPVIADQIEKAMLGHGGRTLDEARIDQTAAQRRLARLERDLRQQVTQLRDQLDESIRELHVQPENVERVIRIGLDLGNQLHLRPATLVRPKGDTAPSAPVFAVPPLTHGWARAALDLPHPADPTITRPITFEHAVADGHDDVVLVHLGHRLTQMAMRLLRAEVWASGTGGSMSRVTARVVPDAASADMAVVAHARLVIAGADGRRLHEEVFEAGGYIRGLRFARFESLTAMQRAVDAGTDVMPSEARLRELARDWESIDKALFAAVEARAAERYLSLTTSLADRAGDDERKVREVLEDLQRRILEELKAPELEQLRLSLNDDDERDQLRRDVDGLRRRIDEIPDEIEREVEQLRRRFADPRRLVFPAAVTFLVPQRLADAT